MIQIVAQRLFQADREPVFVYTEPVILLPNLSTVYAKSNEVLAALPEEERYNLFYTLAHHTGTSGASKPQRKNGTFEYQTVLAWDIDADDKKGGDDSKPDTGRSLEYAAVLAGILEVTPEAFTVITSGNGIHLIAGLKHPIRSVAFFDENREAYKEILIKLKSKLRDGGLGGAGDLKIFDGGRVLRLPGSRNKKPDKADTLCQLVQFSKHQVELDLFKLSGLKARSKEAVSPREIARQYPTPDFAEMVRECEFVKWTYKHPDQVHEPQAFDLFSLLAPQLPDAKAETPWGQVSPREFGEQVFNRAKNSASLKKGDFESKWKQAKDYGGRKCETIHNGWIGGCEQCPHWGKIPTPLALKSKTHVGSHTNGYWVFGEKGKQLHPHYEDLGKVYREEKPYLVTEEGRIMGFNGKFYREAHELEVKAWVDTKVDPTEPLREVHRSEFLHHVRARGALNGVATAEFFQKTTRGRLNCDNGILEIITGRLLPHSAGNGFQYVLPYSIDLASEGSEAFLDWLGQITEDRPELMESILDLMAYAIWPHYDDHLFAYFVGVGANGKSTLIHLIQALVGADNYSTVGIQQLSQNRFAPAQLEGKLVNLSEESSGGSEMDFAAMNVIKTLSAGGTMMVENKGEKGFSFTNQAKMIFSANQAPRFKETGHAIQRRMLVIPFDHVIQNPDKRVEDQLIAEAPKIAAMLVRRIQEKILAEGTFKVSRGGAVAEKTKQQVIYGQNTAVEWGQEHLESSLEVGKDVYIRCEEAYGHYRLWCEANGYTKPLSQPMFGRVIGAVVLSPVAKSESIRVGKHTQRVYRYTKFKEGAQSYAPELRQ